MSAEGSDAEVKGALDQLQDVRGNQMVLMETLEKRLGIPGGFFEALIGEPNDWAFIIKLAVLAEAAVTHALVLHVKDDQLFEHFSNVANYRRLQLAVDLGILDALDKNTLAALAEVRNSFAHRVENLNGSLKMYFERCSPAKKVELLTKLVRLDGEMRPRETDDFSHHAETFRIWLHLGSLRPLLSIATYGLETDKREAEKKQWSLSDLYTGKGALASLASQVRKAGAGAEMYREKIIR